MHINKSILTGLGFAALGAVGGVIVSGLATLAYGILLGAAASFYTGGGIMSFMSGMALIPTMGGILGGCGGSLMAGIFAHQDEGSPHGRVAFCTGLLATGLAAYNVLPAVWNGMTHNNTPKNVVSYIMPAQAQTAQQAKSAAIRLRHPAPTV